jgi:hypothetical protein
MALIFLRERRLTRPALDSVRKNKSLGALKNNSLDALKNNSFDVLVLPAEFSPNFPALIGALIVTVPLGKYPANATVVPNTFRYVTAIAPNLPFGISFMGLK